MYSFTNKEKLGEMEFQIQWVTQNDDEKIIIEDGDQLEEIYMLHGIQQDNKIPRFKVLVREEDSEAFNDRNLEESDIVKSTY